MRARARALNLLVAHLRTNPSPGLRGEALDMLDRHAWYFRTVKEAQAFVARFPMLELADGTELPTYQSPYLQFGRGAEWSDPVCWCGRPRIPTAE